MKTFFITLVFTLSLSAYATPREQAWKLHNRLAGVPPKRAVLLEMERLIEGNRAEDAAELAMANKNFLNLVMKNWIKPWSNREQSARVDLNDYVATVLGIINEDEPFTKVLYDDVIYTVNGPATAYNNANNTHYQEAETANLDLAATLQRNIQSQLTGIAAPSGVITTRASGEAFFSAGTNRRVNRFTFINYLCHDYEDLHDTSIPDYRVRKDVERNPGGDSRTYKNKCVGCHAGQDALGGAYAYYNFVGTPPQGQLSYTAGTVTPKINQNNYFNDGHQTVNDSWLNLWATGQNAKLGWKGPASGNGAKSLNEMFGRSRAFSQCMAKKVFKLVCMKDAKNTDDLKAVEAHALSFENGYSLKNLIVKTSVGCIVNE